MRLSGMAKNACVLVQRDDRLKRRITDSYNINDLVQRYRSKYTKQD
jgi:hypothetical protein